MNWLDALERVCDLFCDKPDCTGCEHLEMMNDIYDHIEFELEGEFGDGVWDILDS